MRFHTRSVLEGELVLELGKLSVTYLTAHCEIFVRITEAAPRAPVRALLADRVISFGRLPSLRRASQSALATDRISRPTSSFPKTCPFHCSLRLLQPLAEEHRGASVINSLRTALCRLAPVQHPAAASRSRSKSKGQSPGSQNAESQHGKSGCIIRGQHEHKGIPLRSLAHAGRGPRLTNS